MLRQVLLVSVFISAAYSDCPDGWAVNGNSCYFLSTEFGGVEKHLSFHEAISYCEVQNGHLAVIHDADENMFLQKRLTDKGVQGQHWIGLHDLQKRWDFVWVDGSALDYTNWQEGDPDHYDHGPKPGVLAEACVEFIADGDNKGQWRDNSCTPRQHYICERDINVGPATVCADDWVKYADRCYHFGKEQITWSDAQQACVDQNSNLVAITSSEEQIFVSSEVNNNNQMTWIGLTNINSEDGKSLYWSNMKDVYDKSAYNNWAPLQPGDLAGSGSDCTQITPGEGNSGGQWNIARCGETYDYMCERRFEGSCADGWRMFNGSCYLIVTGGGFTLNWVEAHDYCVATGGDMLMIDGDWEMSYIRSRLSEVEDSGSNGLWIGVSDTDQDGVFTWVDGTADSDIMFKQWAPNQPYDNADSWDCGQIYTSSSNGNWETEDCFKKQSFICETPTGADVSVPEIPSVTHAGCPPGWLWWNTYCYFFEKAITADWSTAESECVRYGGHLTSIGSNEENGFITGHTSGNFWIGGTDVQLEGTFRWIDGTIFNYTDFQDGEPNSSGNCIQVWSDANYRWDDLPCDQIRPYICKKQETPCLGALGMENYEIKDNQITSTPPWNEQHRAALARLNNQPSGGDIGAFAPLDVAPGTQWIAVRLSREHQVVGVTTQGRPSSDYLQWVTSFNLQYMDMDSHSWADITNERTGTTLFIGNDDSNTPVTNTFSKLLTNEIKLIPQDYFGHPTIRMEILGCQKDGTDTEPNSGGAECTTVETADRLDCGYAGITAPECKSKGCCWDTTYDNVPWCFYKKGEYDKRCGAGWVYDPTGSFKCFYFNEQRHRTWFDARGFCKELDITSDIITIQNSQEQAFVAGQIISKPLTPSFWIGADDQVMDSGWMWKDGEEPFKYTNWADGQPDGKENRGSNCGEIYTSDGKWNDIDCNEERALACTKVSHIAPVQPVKGDPDSLLETTCEGEVNALVCYGSDVIVVEHAYYGRTDTKTCAYDDGYVPVGGCKSNNSLEIVQEQCNFKSKCEITASNEIFGDPCHGVYKYLSVVYRCEPLDCYQYLGVANGTIKDNQLSASSSLDSSHQAIAGRLDGPMSWATSEGVGAWIQVTLPTPQTITGLVIQGAGDAERYVTSFTVGFSTDVTYTNWIDYENDGVQLVFDGNKDPSVSVRAVFADKLYTAGIRIYPLSWSGDMIGMRFEITGCAGTQELGCFDTGDTYFKGDDIPIGTVVTGECKSGCQVEDFIPLVYGTGIYSGMSQVCSAAIHAGVILYTIGGPVSMIKKDPQSAYTGSKQNEIFSFDYKYYETAFAFTQSEKTCEAGWKAYGEYCYQLSDDLLSWTAAQEKCKSKGGNLAAIINSISQDFIQSYIIESNYTDIWIGLNDLQSVNEYAWTDGRFVTYTNWAPNEPNNWEGKRESCVEIYRDSGKWNDAYCENVEPYICEKLKDFYTSEETDGPTPDPGCDKGWVAFEDKCYFFDTEQFDGVMKEEDAATYCASIKADMLTIPNNYVQSFIHSQIGQLDKFWWLGMHAQISQNGATSWVWENGDTLTYDNWFYENPNIKLGECATFFGGPGFGFWYSTACELSAYPVCQKARDPDAYTPRPDPTPPPSGGCPGGWVYADEGDTYYDETTNYCYKIMTQSTGADFTQQTWNNAKHQCMGLQGDLVSIHSSVEQSFMYSELTKLGIETQPVWIGLYSLNGRWTWSDNTALNYETWRKGYPSIDPLNNCVVMRFDPDDDSGKINWENVNCAETMDWICKRKKGIIDVEPTSPPTGKPNPQCGTSSDSTGLWLEYDGLCYLFSDVAQVSYNTAQAACKETGGDLASIHSDLEQQFIANTIKDLTGTNHFWIGLRETGGGIGGEFSWSDGTIVDYVSWIVGEPNDADGMEQCVDVRKANGGDWNDANCALDISGFICKKYIGAVPQPLQPPAIISGGCPSGWYSYGGYCHQLHGDVDSCDPEKYDNPDCAAAWVDAQKMCQKSGANLVTIHDKYENAFLTSQILHAYHNVWIGMNDKSWSRYTWASGDEVTYTNWNGGEPNHSNGAENCVEIYRSETHNGRWNDAKCEDPKPYYCTKQQDPSIKAGNEINNNKKCKSGWLRFDTVGGEYICYKYDETPRTFDDAVKYCKQQGSTVASVQSMFEQNFIASFVKDSTSWIGMQFDMDSYAWKWVDNWPVYVTNWGEAQPGSDLSKACAVYSDGDFGSEWLTVSCASTFPTICRTTTETVPTPALDVAGYCADDSWKTYGGFCYFAYSLEGNADDVGLTYSDAEDQCKLNKGHLVSYGSRDELNTVWSWFSNTTETFWIGLRQNANGGWAWTDGRPVDFTWWNNGEPNNLGDENEGEDCVEQSGSEGKWNDLKCSRTKGYICRVPKVIGTDENGGAVHYTTPAPNSGPTTKGTNMAGVVIGILIAVVVVALAVIGGLIYCKKQGNSTASKITDTASDFSSGFVNKLYSVTKPTSTNQGGSVAFDRNMDNVNDFDA